jgi:hypothetical protein
MLPTMYGRVTTAMTTTMSRIHGIPDAKDGDNEPMWSLEFASSWVRLDVACGSHALAESEPLIITDLVMLPPQRPTVARAGCVAKARSNNEHITRSLDGLPSLVPFLYLPRTSFQSYWPSTSFASRSSLHRFLTALIGQSLGVLHVVSATAPLRFWLRTRLLWVAWASSVTSSLSTTTQFSASRSAASSAYSHPASSLLYGLPLLVLLAISRLKLCGVRSRRRVLICRMILEPLFFLSIWLEAAEMLRSTLLTLGK